MAYRSICNADVWPFKEATDSSVSLSSGTATYNMPSGIQIPLGMWLDSIAPENKVSPLTRKMREAFSFSGSTGKPIYYFLFASTVTFYPTPASSYTLKIEYEKDITALSADSDTPIFDVDFHYLIAQLAAAMLKKTSGGTDINEADNLIQDVNIGLTNMRARLLPRQLDRPLQVEDVWNRYSYDDLFNQYN